MNPVQETVEALLEANVRWREDHPQVIEGMTQQAAHHYAYALVEAGLIPTRGEWGVLDAGRVRNFGSEARARKYAEANGLRVVHIWPYDWKIID